MCLDNTFIQRLPHHAQSGILNVTTPSTVVFRVCHDSHHERTTIPENTSFEWSGIFTQRVLMDAVCTAVVGSARTRVLDADSDRED